MCYFRQNISCQSDRLKNYNRLFLNKAFKFLLSLVAYSLGGHSHTLVNIEIVSWKILQENVFILTQQSIQAELPGLYCIFNASR